MRTAFRQWNGDPFIYALRDWTARLPTVTIGQERTFATLCTCFAALAAVIAFVGLYGLMAYSVARRTNEIGIRMALGAERRGLIWMVLREVLAMTLLGRAIGLPTALATTRYVGSFLFRMKPKCSVPKLAGDSREAARDAQVFHSRCRLRGIGNRSYSDGNGDPSRRGCLLR